MQRERGKGRNRKFMATNKYRLILSGDLRQLSNAPENSYIEQGRRMGKKKRKKNQSVETSLRLYRETTKNKNYVGKHGV